jgi:hypothetical protein
MSNLSSKDKARLALSAKRVERWNRERHVPVNNGKARCTSIVFANGQDKPGEVIKPDAMGKVHALSDGHKMRLPCGKLTLLRNGDNFSDYHDADYSESPRDPAWKAGQAKLVTPRKDSPFKRAGKSATSVVIVRV